MCASIWVSLLGRSGFETILELCHVHSQFAGQQVGKPHLNWNPFVGRPRSIWDFKLQEFCRFRQAAPWTRQTDIRGRNYKIQLSILLCVGNEILYDAV